MQITTIWFGYRQERVSSSRDRRAARRSWFANRRGQVLEFFKALPPCLIGMEACATAHYWARELTKLDHRVRLMPAKDVKAYVKRNKNDAADAEAICEAVQRPTMRFVQIESGRAAGPVDAIGRAILVRQRTQVMCGTFGRARHCGCLQGREGIKELLKIIASEEDARLPVDAHASLVVLAAELQAMQTMIGSIDKRIVAQHRSNEPAAGECPWHWGQRRHTSATSCPDRRVDQGRDFAAWIGLVPREDSTRPSRRLGPISKRGDRCNADGF